METLNSIEAEARGLDENNEHGAMSAKEEEMKEEADKLLPKRYTLEVFMSTDGKHTVHVTTDDPTSRHEAVKKAMEMYDYVLARYGTKQAQAVKEYGNGKTAEAPKVDQGSCSHVNVQFYQVKKEGPNTGKWFKSCKDCKKFMGWQ